MARVLLALGSNLGPRRAILSRALELLGADPGVRVVRVSELALTEPMGPSQPAYLNGVAELETSLSPEALLSLCQAIERRLGRVRSRRVWGPRTVDLDLLTYDDREIRRRRLVLPHPGIGRSFLAAPLASLERDPP